MPDAIAVQAMDPDKKNSPVSGPVQEQATVMLDTASSVCLWNDEEFRDGQIVEHEGNRFECSFGRWVTKA